VGKGGFLIGEGDSVESVTTGPTAGQAVFLGHRSSSSLVGGEVEFARLGFAPGLLSWQDKRGGSEGGGGGGVGSALFVTGSFMGRSWVVVGVIVGTPPTYPTPYPAFTFSASHWLVVI